MSVDEARARDLALNKLRALDAQVYTAGDVLLGKLRLRPHRFRLPDKTELAAEQPFVVQDIDRIQFVPPSPLVHLGRVFYLDVIRAEALEDRILGAWREAVGRATRTLDFAAGFDPKCQFRPETWTVEACLQVDGLAARLAIQGDGTQFRVLTVDGRPIDRTSDWTRAVRPLNVADVTEAQHQLLRAVQDLRYTVAPEVVAPTVVIPRDEVAPGPDLSVVSQVQLQDLVLFETLDGAHLSRPSETPALLFEDAVEIDATDLAPIRKRPSRIPMQVRACLLHGEAKYDVDVVQISAGGAFLALPLERAPPVDSFAVLSGFGERIQHVRIAHHRGREEADLLGTREGVGVAFQSAARRELPGADRPTALIVARNGPIRTGLLEAALVGGYRLVVAESLLAAAAAFHQDEIELVLADAEFAPGRWQNIGDALAWDAGQTRIVIVSASSEALALQWAECVGFADLPTCLGRFGEAPRVAGQSDPLYKDLDAI